ITAPARPTSAAPSPQPSANTLFLSMPTSATAPASSRVASRARPKSVRLMKKYSAANAAIDTSAPTSCGTGREEPKNGDGFAAEPGMRDAAIIRREEELRQPAHHDGEPEGGKDLHHAGIGF